MGSAHLAEIRTVIVILRLCNDLYTCGIRAIDTWRGFLDYGCLGPEECV